jgi:hypothetical protein
LCWLPEALYKGVTCLAFLMPLTKLRYLPSSQSYEISRYHRNGRSVLMNKIPFHRKPYFR